MDKLNSLWSNLRLNEEEDTSIMIEEEAVSEIKKKGDLSLIGKILSDRQLATQVVESTLKKIWRLSKPTTLREVGRNMYVMIFATHVDKQRIVEGRPWFFDGQLFVINPFDGISPIHDLKFHTAPLWVQFHNLPMFGMNREVGVRLGSSIGEVQEVDVDDDNVGWGSSLRVKILIDMKKPLARGSTCILNGVKVWSPVQHEKLPRFCFTCGQIIHENVECQSKTDSSPQYGAWLRAASSAKKKWD
ncbi:uncharacterized protein LOC122280957 [Carya illinoinensis]|uniref:uncharacterized protein LOC122280957 n=1 Tax=Carya illinoinensis TaxID=32201 RepID=UPI001C72325D|nr:uncharacterized protein LOC122280957 [Carya illinoinensis]